LDNPNTGEKSDAILSTPDQKDPHKKETDQVMKRSKSEGGARRAYRSVKFQEAENSPSPWVAGCRRRNQFLWATKKKNRERRLVLRRMKAKLPPGIPLKKNIQ